MRHKPFFLLANVVLLFLSITLVSCAPMSAQDQATSDIPSVFSSTSFDHTPGPPRPGSTPIPQGTGPVSPIDLSTLPLCPEDPTLMLDPSKGCRPPDLEDLLLCPDNQQTPVSRFGCRSPITNQRIIGVPLSEPLAPLPGLNGEVIVYVPPCITPVPIADYRELLAPGTHIYGPEYFIKGYDISGQPIPTLVASADGDAVKLIDPATAIIVYQSMGPCERPTVTN